MGKARGRKKGRQNDLSANPEFSWEPAWTALKNDDATALLRAVPQDADAGRIGMLVIVQSSSGGSARLCVAALGSGAFKCVALMLASAEKCGDGEALGAMGRYFYALMKQVSNRGRPEPPNRGVMEPAEGVDLRVSDR
jgi:hypothetical protein